VVRLGDLQGHLLVAELLCQAGDLVIEDVGQPLQEEKG
jgi:hypothetical protein